MIAPSGVAAACAGRAAFAREKGEGMRFSTRKLLRKRRVRFGLGVLAVAGIVAVPIAWASHDFTDVPDASPFHGDIAAVKRAGITSGKTCVPPGTPPTYCPGEPITREAMAAFVHRGFSRAALAVNSEIPIAEDPNFTEISTLTINTGGVAGGTGFVVLNAFYSAYAPVPTTGCPCEVRFVLTNGDQSDESDFTYDVLSDSSPDPFGGAAQQTGAITWALPVPTATTQTFRLFGQIFGKTSGTPNVVAYGRITGVYTPFGSTGTDVLGGAVAAVDNVTGQRRSTRK
jgi:hypothetical protein